jgi:hypothetical protein
LSAHQRANRYRERQRKGEIIVNVVIDALRLNTIARLRRLSDRQRGQAGDRPRHRRYHR